MGIKRLILSTVNMICTLTIFLIFLTRKSYMYSKCFVLFTLFFSVLTIFICPYLLKKSKIKLSKLIFLLNVLFSVIFLIYHLLKVNGLLYMFSSVSNLKNFILSTKQKGVIIYILVQMAQIVIFPIPASVIAIAGAIIYGPFLGSIYCTVGVLLGSYLSFLIGRTLGYKLVCWVVGSDNAKKYAHILNSNGKFFLGIAFLLPMFPDDILCLISGLTNMSFRYFFTIATIFRPIGVICMCFFGSGSIIPFTGWGIPLWIVIGVIMFAIVLITYKYQNKMEEWIINKFSKNKNKYSANKKA